MRPGYVVVFVGYTADDPPVQYLLEALNRSSGSLENIYAFQSGGENDAAARWRHKGVRSIAYNAATGHEALGARESDNRWPDLLIEFLQIVWPKQISAKSSTVSTQLCNLALSSNNRFPQIVNIILPLLTKIDRDHIFLPNLRKSKNSVVDRFPERTLALLDAVLPENASAWPYGIEQIFERIEKSDSTLATDERLLSLKRRWNAR